MDIKQKQKLLFSTYIKPAFTAGFLLWFVAIPVQADFVRNIVFPVDGEHRFSDDFGDARSGGREHEANDIFADKMTKIVSATDGVVRYIVNPEADWGYAIFIKDSEGWEYRYLHINNDTPGTDDGRGTPATAYAPGISRGTSVKAGQHIAWVGDSGNAEWTAPHLHFEIRRPDGAAINPYESLQAASLPSQLGPNGEVVKTRVVIPSGGILIKYASNPKVYLLIDGTKRHIADEESFTLIGKSWNQVKTIPDTEQYRTGVPIKVTEGVMAVYEDGTPVVLDAAERILASGFVFTDRLAFGSKGEEVVELQRTLRSLGYFTYTTNTGYYGSVTQSAVKAFQRARGISPIGIVGPETRAALNSL